MKHYDVVAAAIEKDGKIFCCKRGKEKECPDKWEFPGGKIEQGETHQEALTREIKEELNAQIRVDQHITTINHQYETFSITMYIFFCTLEKGEIKLIEHQDSVWCDIDQLDTIDFAEADAKAIEQIQCIWKTERIKSEESIWEKLYLAAKAVQNNRSVSKYVEAGGVAAVILSTSGTIYTGVCIDTCSTLGICAERNAIFQMITNGEQEIKKVLAIMPNGKTGTPCGACRELMVQLMPNNYQEIEIMADYETGKVVTLEELTPKWWI
ncbi:MAG: NUDIX domain-containing protein [Anaeroplasma bactoclasticum]|nr:NUDIX domain-containing protein [Anaeroplasma bactoclasticum]